MTETYAPSNSKLATVPQLELVLKLQRDVLTFRQQLFVAERSTFLNEIACPWDPFAIYDQCIGIMRKNWPTKATVIEQGWPSKTKSQVSSEINRLMEQVRKVRGELNAHQAKVAREEREAKRASGEVQLAGKAEMPDGIYQVGDRIYKVQKAVHGSGKMVAKLLIIEPNPAFDTDTPMDETFDSEGQPRYLGKFKYQGLATRYIMNPDEARLSKEEAVKYGKLYGFCVRCAATLTDDESIARGMGPICSGKF